MSDINKPRINTTEDDPAFAPSGSHTSGYTIIDCSNPVEDRIIVELDNDFLDSLIDHDEDSERH